VASKRISQITAAEWIDYTWLDVATVEAGLRMMVRGLERLPEDRAHVARQVATGRLTFPMPDEPALREKLG
jgi:hypothetical protein